VGGEFADAMIHLEQASPRLDWGRSEFFGIFYPCFGAWGLWALGYADKAIKWSRDALAAAEALSRPALFGNALNLTAHLQMFLRDARKTQERAEAAIAIAAEYGLPFELSNASFDRGWAISQQGYLVEGIAEMRRSAVAMAAQGFTRPRSFTFLAAACCQSEGPDVGLKVLAEGFALLERTGERMFEAELHRVKGELLLAHQGQNTEDADQCFRAALEVARRQGAKTLELRATVSLARMLAKQSKRDEARVMLADIYNWFTEGFDTADLIDAKALLDELSA